MRRGLVVPALMAMVAGMEQSAGRRIALTSEQDDHDDPDWCRCTDWSVKPGRWINLEGGQGFHGERVHYAHRVGRKAAGRLLDGRTHDGFPEGGAS